MIQHSNGGKKAIEMVCSYFESFTFQTLTGTWSLAEDSSIVFSFLNWFSLDPMLLSSLDCPAFRFEG